MAACPPTTLQRSRATARPGLPIARGLARFLLAWIVAAPLGLATRAEAVDSVVLQLQWDHQFQFAGYYAALWQGYYEQADLSVTMVPGVAPGGAVRNTIDEVVAGRAQFGIGSTNLLVARDSGKPVVVVAPILQSSAVAIFSRAEANVQSPADLLKLRMFLYPGSLVTAEVLALFRAVGADATEIPRSTDLALFGINAVHDDVTDAFAGYGLDVLWQASRMGIALRRLRPATYGADFYGDTLFTREDIARERPGLVRRFLEASVKGWVYALQHPEEVAERIASDLPRTTPVEDPIGFNLTQADQVAALTQYPDVAIGTNDIDRWAGIHHSLRDSGLVTREFDAKGFLFDFSSARSAKSERSDLLLMALLGSVVLLLGAGAVFNVAVKQRVRLRTADLRASEERLIDARDALRHSEARLKQAQALAKLGSFEISATGSVQASEQLAKMLGTDPAARDILESYLALVHADDRAAVRSAFADAKVRSGVPLRHRARIYGEERTLDLLLVEEESGAVLGTLQDVTSQAAAEEALRKGVRERETLLREVHHRVKNNLQMVSSLLYLSGEAADPAARSDASREIADRLRAMSAVHETLYRSQDFSAVALSEYLEKLVRATASLSREGRVEVRFSGIDIHVPMDTALPCGMIVNELVNNCVKHAFDGRGGIVSVSLTRDGGGLTIVVADTGTHPVDPTRRPSGAAGSFGWQLIHGLAEQLDASIAVDTTNGTKVTLTVPLPETHT